MNSNNIYNNNAKFLKLRADSCSSPYYHKKQSHKIVYFSEARLINDGMNTDKNFFPNKMKLKTNLNISTEPNINISKITSQQQNQELLKKNSNYLLEVRNNNSKIIEKVKKETQSYKKSNSKIRIIKSGIPSFSSNIENTNNNVLCSSTTHLNSNRNLHSTKSSSNMNIFVSKNNNNNNFIYKNSSTRKLDTNNYNILSNAIENNIKKLNVTAGNKISNNNLLDSSNSDIFSSGLQNQPRTKSFYNYGNIGIKISNKNNNNQMGNLFTSGINNYNYVLSSHLSKGKIQEYYNNVNKKQINHNRNNIGNSTNEIYLVNNSTEYMPSSPNSNRVLYKNSNNDIYRNISNDMVKKGYPTIFLKNKSMVTKDNTTATNQSENESKHKKDSILIEQTLNNKNENEKSIEDIHFMFVNMVQNGRKLGLKLEQGNNNNNL